MAQCTKDSFYSLQGVSAQVNNCLRQWYLFENYWKEIIKVKDDKIMIVGKHGDVLCCINYFKTKVLHNHYGIAHLIFVYLFLLDFFC